ncbi:MAG: protein-glutamate O-methyltransferase CheR [Pseudomonadota bacterium]
MTPSSFDYLRTFVKERSGIDLAPDKKYLVETRLQPVARAHGVEGLDALVQTLRGQPTGVLKDAVIEAMTTNESSFFRDRTPFELFKTVMVPELMTARRSARRLRIWCAAASTGQEPYSLAMTIKELGAQLSGWSLSILGTDLSRDVLDKAKAGVYSQFEVQRGMPTPMLLKYFTQEGEQWRIDPSLRSMCDFRPFNLLDSFTGLGQFDIVFCRNVLIYFDQETKRDILDRIKKSLAPDGYLVLGSAETVMGITQSFEQVSGARGLYRPAGTGQESAAQTGAAATRQVAALRQTADAMKAAIEPARPVLPSSGDRPVFTARTALKR